MKRVRKIEIITVAVLLLFSNSCIMNLICIDGNGISGTETRDDHDFTKIVNTTDADVIFTVGDNYSVSVEADQNLLKYYKTSVSGSSLEIEIKGTNCVKSISSPVIRVTAPAIDKFTLTGSGNMVGDYLSGSSISIINTGSGNIFIDYAQASNLKTKLSGSGDITISDSNSDEVTVIISGSGDATIDGEADMGIFTSTGSGQNYSGNLSLNTCSATITGSGDIYTMVSNELNANITGSGNLYYTGSAQVYQTITGSGRIIRLPK